MAIYNVIYTPFVKRNTNETFVIRYKTAIYNVIYTPFIKRNTNGTYLQRTRTLRSSTLGSFQNAIRTFHSYNVINRYIKFTDAEGTEVAGIAKYFCAI